MSHLTSGNQINYLCSTEPKKLPNSGQPHPSDLAVFLRLESVQRTRPMPVFQRREGTEISLYGQILSAVCLRFLSLPAPFLGFETLKFGAQP